MDTKLRTLAAVLLFALAATCLGAVSRTQAVSANATTVSITSTSANDLIVVMAYDSVATIPTLSSGYTSVTSNAGTGQAFNVAYKVSSGGDTDCGTWTNATQIVCHVYSGALAIGTGFATGVSNTATTTANFNTITMQVTDGSSWVVGMIGAKTATSMTGSTTLLTNRTNVTTAAGLDSGTGLTSYAGETLTITSSRYQSIVLEIKSSGGGGTPAPTNRFFPFIKP